MICSIQENHRRGFLVPYLLILSQLCRRYLSCFLSGVLYLVAAVPQHFILALSLAACQQSRLGVSVGNWLKTNLHPPASLVRGVAAPQRMQHKDQKGLSQAGGELGLLKLVLTELPDVSSGK